ncbi:hypothetical protein XENTR_v10007588 [Xenopus tropicalis]|nr:hypothetical protein XENTR_v10007588 [Xenopus tropicalis]
MIPCRSVGQFHSHSLRHAHKGAWARAANRHRVPGGRDPSASHPELSQGRESKGAPRERETPGPTDRPLPPGNLIPDPAERNSQQRDRHNRNVPGSVLWRRRLIGPETIGWRDSRN